MNAFAQKIAFLESHGVAELAHSEANLLTHLRGVHDLLAEWGSRQALCDAGLFHSVYGTEIFPTGAIPHELRPAVQDLIGAEAEMLAYLFGTVTRSALFDAAFDGPPFLLEDRSGGCVGVSAGQYADLAALTVANWLEQRPRFAEASRFSRAREFDAMRRYLPNTVRTALERAYGFAPLALAGNE
ncbi:DUF6817 domain-containing protein [Micromonospora sp. LH3U1]|uniref:DUF6817 domain-containing protein n=1 Tax=Micromonospora sp. LH3U1 TaxID=3018339 RepID=UPI002349D57A|nr:hypothetical protein [Micromonospora sp. LH3U1]WCN82392.1 hypothetical protein PCA76_04740 [Micromonospora sp. LH3U1]